MHILFDTKTAAPRIGVTVATLENWRTRGEGPAFIKTPGRTGKILYRQDDIDAWIASRRFHSTAEANTCERRAMEGRGNV